MISEIMVEDNRKTRLLMQKKCVKMTLDIK